MGRYPQPRRHIRVAPGLLVPNSFGSEERCDWEHVVGFSCVILKFVFLLLCRYSDRFFFLGFLGGFLLLLEIWEVEKIPVLDGV